MDHSFFFNPLSTPAQSADDAYVMLFDAYQGVLALDSGENDRFLLYFDNITGGVLEECLLAKEYNYSDFLKELKNNNEIDLLSFLFEMVDKSPALNYLKDEQVDDLASCNFYIPDTGSNDGTDFLGMSWSINATLLSLPTNDRWDSSRLVIARLVDGAHIEERFTLDNISRFKHGEELSQKNAILAQKTLDEICPQCQFTSPFTRWVDELDLANRKIVFKKLELASEKNFQGGYPLFETLENADGMREIRFSAHQGGAVRILFGALSEQKQALLIGFIKKSDNEGYKENIPRARKQWLALKKIKKAN